MKTYKPINPDPKKYVLKKRKGKWVPVDRQVHRYGKKGYKVWKTQERLTEQLNNAFKAPEEASSTPPLAEIKFFE